MELLPLVETTTFDAPQIAAHAAQVQADLLRQTRYLDAPNFTKIHPSDLKFLFDAYDRVCFQGQLRLALGAAPLSFALSQRMTSAGGKTARITDRRSGFRRFEISVSVAILFNCFRADDHRPIVTSGIVCLNRLDALQRVMEHELTHLAEMLLWDKSSCAQRRFHSITKRFFGHTENKHQLITPRERAIAKFGIQPGMQVRFRFDGVEHTGVVNRINKRATVLVEDARGQRYDDGKRYAKYYIPVACLTPVK